MKVHLLDGTYELFRQHFARPSHLTADGMEVGGTRGVLESIIGLLSEGVTHIGVATDHVIESFRNDMWPGYKSSAGMPPELLAQFPLVEDVLRALGLVVWPMVDVEADDALAAAASGAAADPRVEQVVIMTPDKDLAQCVVGDRVVQLDRRTGVVSDADGVVKRFGVRPESIPDWLALVGDSSDGFPGLKGWGAKSASAVLLRYGHLEDIPHDHWRWDVDVRGATRLAASLNEQRELAELFRDLATLRTEPAPFATVDALRWVGPTAEFEAVAARLDRPQLVSRAQSIAKRSMTD
jgi:5'-3' exonuclease